MLFILLIVNTLIYLLLVVYQCKHYYFPYIQRICLRIFFILPLYSLLAFVRFYNAELVDICYLIQHTYESFVLFYYFRFIVYCLGNERNYYHLRYIKEIGAIEDIEGSHTNLIIHNDSIMLLSDHIIQEFLGIKSGIFQYCLFMPMSSLLEVIIEYTCDLKSFSFASIINFLLILGQNISISYCLYKIVYFLKLINFIDHNYAKLFLILKGLIGLLFWQNLVADYFIPKPLLDILCSLLNVIIPMNHCTPVVIVSAIEIVEYLLLGIIFYFTFHPIKLSQLILIHYKDITEDPEHPKYIKTLFPFMETRFPLKLAIKDALGVKDVWLDIQNLNKVYKSDVFTEIEQRIHTSNINRLNKRSRRSSASHYSSSQPITHYEDDATYLKEEDVHNMLYTLNRPTPTLKNEFKHNDMEDKETVEIEFVDSHQDDQLYSYARRIGGFGYRVIQDGHLEL